MSASVSTIITSFNKGPFLAEAIQSALAQDYSPHEILVIDDGSTDNTREVCAAFGDRIRYIYQENRGQASAKNRGIKVSSGEFIAFLDGDDRWRPGKLRRQVELLSGCAEVAVVYTRALYFNDATGTIWESHRRAGGGPARGYVMDRLLSDNFVPFSSSMVRRAHLLEVGTFDESERRADDLDLWLRLARRYQFDYVDGPYLEYRTGIDQLTSQVGGSIATVKIIDKFVARCFGGKYPRPHVLWNAKANRFSAHGDVMLSAGRHIAAILAYVRAFYYQPLNWQAYLRVARACLPNRCVEQVKRVANAFQPTC